MKNLFYSLVVAANILIPALTTNGFAQSPALNRNLNGPVILQSSTGTEVQNPGIVKKDDDAYNAKAVRDFTTRFTEISDEKWYKIPTGVVAYFYRDNNVNRIFYDKKGRWLSSWKIYTEKNLPGDIRHRVKSNYYDYAINLVQEIEFQDNLTYVLKMEDADQFMTLQVSAEGEFKELEKIKKSK